jgi:hypothetical protein
MRKYNKFNWKKQTIAGYYGEMLWQQRLRENEISVLSDKSPIRHSFDFLSQKNAIIEIQEVKVAEELFIYKNSNGVNYNNHMEYLKISNTINIPFNIIWIDKKRKEIYGNEFKKLLIQVYHEDGHSYPKHIEGKTGDKMLYSIDNMNIYDSLTNDEINTLTKIGSINELILSNNTIELVYDIFKDNLEYLNIYFDLEISTPTENKSKLKIK